MADNGTIAPTNVCIGVSRTHMTMPVFTAILEILKTYYKTCISIPCF